MKSKILLPFLLILLLTTPGCYLLDTQTNVETGKEETRLEVVLDKIEAAIGKSAPIVNTFAPGVDTIAGGVGVLLSLIGGLTTSVVVARRRGGALAAVIKGVEAVSNKETKESIKEIAGNIGVEKYLNKLVKEYFPL